MKQPTTCVGCDRPPHNIAEYHPKNTGTDMQPADYVINEEGTYNSETGDFYCTDCYIKAGMPMGVATRDPEFDPTKFSYPNRTTYSDGEYNVTGPEVCKSAAGWYIGTYCKLVDPVDENDCMIGIAQPNSRDSLYFASYALAKQYLDASAY